jgi:hypothetical protein
VNLQKNPKLRRDILENILEEREAAAFEIASKI